jgi:hypothetical protein
MTTPTLDVMTHARCEQQWAEGGSRRDVTARYERGRS